MKKSPRKNYVLEAYEKVGGVVQATAIMRVSPETARQYKLRGKIGLAEAALRLAKSSGIAVEKLIGLEDG